MKLLKYASLALGIMAASTTSLMALSISDSFGWFDPATPADLPTNAAYINTLLDQTLNVQNTVGAQTYLKTKDTTGYVDATAVGSIKKDVGDAGFNAGAIDVTGWTYLLGKYGNTAYVWFVGNLSGLVSIPTTGPALHSNPQRTWWQDNGLSHYSLYNPTSVPDTASTLALLALGLVSLGLIARRRKA